MLVKSFWLYKSLKDGIAITTKITTGINVHATSRSELWVVVEGFLLFLALNLTHTYAKSKNTKIVIAVIIQKQNRENQLTVALTETQLLKPNLPFCRLTFSN